MFYPLATSGSMSPLGRRTRFERTGEIDGRIRGWDGAVYRCVYSGDTVYRAVEIRR